MPNQFLVVGSQYVIFISLLVGLLGFAAAAFYQKSERYKGLYQDQKRINNYNYEYWLAFFQRHGILKEVILDEKTGDRTWVLLTDPIHERQKEVQVAITEFMAAKLIEGSP